MTFDYSQILKNGSAARDLSLAENVIAATNQQLPLRVGEKLLPIGHRKIGECLDEGDYVKKKIVLSCLGRILFSHSSIVQLSLKH